MKLFDITGIEPDWKNELINEPDYNLPLPKIKIGVEVELEKVKRSIVDGIDSIYWETTPEQSLRGYLDNLGIEFRFKQALHGRDIRASFDEFEEMFEVRAPHTGNRCSTHVHIDVRNLHIEDVHRIFNLYTILERPLFHYEGTDRENSFYCVPVYKLNNKNIQRSFNKLDYQSLPGHQHKNVQKRAIAKRFLDSFQKYGAIHLKSVRNIGSIEFRMMHAMYKSDELWEWVYILQSIVKYALSVDSLDKLPVDISMRGVQPFMEEVFGKELAQKLNYGNLDIDIYKGIRVSQEHIYSTDFLSYSEYVFNQEGDLCTMYTDKFREKNKEKLMLPTVPDNFEGPMEWFEIWDDADEAEEGVE